MSATYTRQQAMYLTGATSNKLSYLDRTGLVVPAKSGNPKHPRVKYTLEQVLTINTIYRLRERLSLQEIRKVLAYLNERSYRPSLFKASLLFFGEKLYLLEQDKLNKMLIELSGKHRGQAVMLRIADPIGDVYEEIQRRAVEHQIPRVETALQKVACS